MSLPAAWVDRIFDKLTITYGRDFTGRYEGLDINAVKSDWGHELSIFFTHPSAIAHALSNLPDRVPSVVEFKKIARTAPQPEVPVIEHSAAGKERIASELAKLAPIVKARHARADSLDWARRIVARSLHGEVDMLPLKWAKEVLDKKNARTAEVDE
jgi:hypothetical protein